MEFQQNSNENSIELNEKLNGTISQWNSQWVWADRLSAARDAVGKGTRWATSTFILPADPAEEKNCEKSGKKKSSVEKSFEKWNTHHNQRGNTRHIERIPILIRKCYWGVTFQKFFKLGHFYQIAHSINSFETHQRNSASWRQTFFLNALLNEFAE